MQHDSQFPKWIRNQIPVKSGRDDIVSDFAHELTKKGIWGIFEKLKHRDEWWYEVDIELHPALEAAWWEFDNESRTENLGYPKRKCLYCDGFCTPRKSRFGHGVERITQGKSRLIGMVLGSPTGNEIYCVCSRSISSAKKDLAKGEYSLIRNRIQKHSKSYGTIKALELEINSQADPSDQDFLLDYKNMPCRIRQPFTGEFERCDAYSYVLVDRCIDGEPVGHKILFSSPLPFDFMKFRANVKTPPPEAIELVTQLRELLSSQLANHQDDKCMI